MMLHSDGWNGVFERCKTESGRLRRLRALSNGYYHMVAEAYTARGLKLQVFVFHDRSGFFASASYLSQKAPMLTPATNVLPTPNWILQHVAHDDDFIWDSYQYMSPGYYIGQDIRALNYQSN